MPTIVTMTQITAASAPHLLLRFQYSAATITGASAAKPVSRDEYLATRGAVDDLGLSGDLRFDHLLRISPTAAVGVVTWFGTVGGGDFENSFVIVYTHDGSRFHTLELFDLDDLDAALARYEELRPAAVA